MNYEDDDEVKMNENDVYITKPSGTREDTDEDYFTMNENDVYSTG